MIVPWAKASKKWNSGAVNSSGNVTSTSGKPNHGSSTLNSSAEK